MSSVECARWKSLRSTSSPAASVVSCALLTASLASRCARQALSAISLAAPLPTPLARPRGPTRATRPARSASPGVQEATGENDVHRLRLSDRARKELCSAGAWHDAEPVSGWPNYGLGGDDEIAGHGELAAAEAIAGNRRDERRPHRSDRVPEVAGRRSRDPSSVLAAPRCPRPRRRRSSPASTMQWIASSLSRFSSAPTSSRMSSLESAFSCSGLLSRTTAIGSSRSIATLISSPGTSRSRRAAPRSPWRGRANPRG